MASSAVDLLFGKIVFILENEASLLSGVRDEIKEIELELNSMRSFLEDAERAGHHSHAKENWVANVRYIACQIEDVLDEFICHMSKQQQWRHNKFTSLFFKGIHFPQNLFLKHKTAAKLQKINKELINMQNRNERYKVDHQLQGNDGNNESRLGNYDRNWLKNESESSLFLKDDDLVGIEKTQHDLLNWLTDGELQRTVISVVGIGGSGKTTLVANSFNKERIKQHFECCAWITVSQQYALEELLRSMIKELAHEKNLENLSVISFRGLGERIQNYLQARRYLIVLDDVWSIGIWQQISRVLPDRRNGSRVLITTRMGDVASFQFGIINHVLELKPLRNDAAWKLFCMKAFPSNGCRCTSHLDSLAKNLAEKCEGLPLAIVALAGLLSCKASNIDEWRIVHDNLNWELSNNPELERVKCILLLSYNNLPYRLKHCFLYCCIFPEDYMIRRKRLIRLWIAEGFVEPLKETTIEAVAERYLNELIGRGLLQVVRRNESGRPKACKMHDILRELAVSLAEAEKCVSKSDGKEEVEDNGIRRLSIEAKDQKEMKAARKPSLSRLHSLFVFAVDDISRSSFNRLPSGFKLLRVLDVEGTPIKELQAELMNLFNLRYLNLTGTLVKELPESIGQLYNLQYLILKRTDIKKLPPGIVKLKNLRYIIVYWYNVSGMQFEYAFGAGVPSNICSLKRLQALTLVEARGSFIKGVGGMTQLRTLSLFNVKEADEKDLCLSIGNLSRLRYLTVMSSNEEEILKMDALVSAPPRLEKLILAGKLEKVPHWFNSLHSLTSLYLHWSRLRDDFLPHVQALPNLGRITMANAYEGERLCFLEGFQKLKILEILKCPRLKEIVMNEGVMRCLQELEIVECQELMTLPHGWESLPDLKHVYLEDVSRGIIDKICGSEIIDQPTIRAIMLRRQEGGEAVTKWVHKIYY